jgi:intracellular multiplication protein IcmE
MRFQGGTYEQEKEAKLAAAQRAAEKSSTTTTVTTITGAPLIKAGTIIFGVLDTAVNSDYPDTPVLVTIVDGPYKGAKLLVSCKLKKCFRTA